MTKRNYFTKKGTKKGALVDCIKHLNEHTREGFSTIWDLRDQLPYFHDNIVPKAVHIPDLYTILYKIGVSTGVCEVRFRIRVPEKAAERVNDGWDMRNSDLMLMTPAEYSAYRKNLPRGIDKAMDYRAAVFILASAEHYQKRMDAKKASLAKRKKKQEDKTPLPMHEKSFYDRVAKRYDTPVVEDGVINMPQLPTSQEVYNAKTDAEVDQQLEDFFTDESPTTEDKPIIPVEESNSEPAGVEPLKALHIDLSYTRLAIGIAAGVFVGMIVSNLITLLFI